jgi:hypothetical protein
LKMPCPTWIRSNFSLAINPMFTMSSWISWKNSSHRRQYSFICHTVDIFQWNNTIINIQLKMNTVLYNIFYFN